MRNCGNRVAKKGNIEILLREIMIANDGASCCFFRAKVLRNLRNIFRFVLQKLRKSFANGNLICSRPVDLFNSSTIIYSVVVIPCRDYFNSGIKHFS